MGVIGTGRVDTSERLAHLRVLMQQQGTDVGAVVVPSEDERACVSFLECSIMVLTRLHPDSSEYPADADKRRGFISGFNGSAGDSIRLMGMQ